MIKGTTIAVIGAYLVAVGVAVYGGMQQDKAQAAPLVTTPYIDQTIPDSNPVPYHDEDTLVIPQGSVDPGLWNYLLDYGWQGRPEDGQEALYPPYDVECWEAEYDEVLYVC